MASENETGRGRVDDRRVCRGQIVRWEDNKYRVLRRRAVDGFAMFQTGGSHEVFLAALDGSEGPGWVGENEVEPAGA